MRRSHLTWLARQLVPTLYRTRYRTDDGAKHFAVWWMWTGRCFAVDDMVVVQP